MIIKFFKQLFTSKPKIEPGDFILTKKFLKNGKEKGGLVLKVENINGSTLKCSKGSFQIDTTGKIRWKVNGYIGISLDNVERQVPVTQVPSILGENIKKKQTILT